MKWARIRGGIVHEVIDFAPAGRFHPDLEFIECPDWTEQGMVHDGNAFVAPPQRVYTKDELFDAVDAIAADKVSVMDAKFQRRSAGRSQMVMIGTAIVLARREAAGTATPAQINKLNAMESMMLTINGIYSARDAIEDDITAGTITTIEQIEADPRWPA